MDATPMPAQTDSPKTFVLVHGAWHGGWCWSRVAQALRARGHRVFTPTQTGLGERQHLLGPDITLDTFVQDIVNVLLWEDLEDVILVGHSFGGLTITGVADVLPQRLRQLVYLDAFILDSGVTTFDTLPLDTVNKLRTAAESAALETLHNHGNGKVPHVSTTPQRHVPALPPPPPKVFGLVRPEDAAFVAQRLTPQPLSVYESALHLNFPIGNNVPCLYLHCVQPAFPAINGSYQWVAEHTDWPRIDLASCHSVMVADPALLVERLLALP
jgi:pimeloyl-ACP methyl ester carboxylesterase